MNYILYNLLNLFVSTTPMNDGLYNAWRPTEESWDTRYGAGWHTGLQQLFGEWVLLTGLTVLFICAIVSFLMVRINANNQESTQVPIIVSFVSSFLFVVLLIFYILVMNDLS